MIPSGLGGCGFRTHTEKIPLLTRPDRKLHPPSAQCPVRESCWLARARIVLAGASTRTGVGGLFETRHGAYP